MVNLVDTTLNLGRSYKEINQELARENGELRQHIAMLISENVQRLGELREQITDLTVQNTDLKEQVRKLMVFKQKCDAVATILLDQQQPQQASISAPAEPLAAVQTRRPARALPAEEIDDIDDGEDEQEDESKKVGADRQQVNNDTQGEQAHGAHDQSHNNDDKSDTGEEESSYEELEDENQEDEEPEELDRIGGAPARTLDPIAELSGEDQPTPKADVTYNDSLDPSINSSVPTFRRDTISQTPSAYHALDSIIPAGLQNSGPKRAEANRASSNMTLMNPGSPIRPISRNTKTVLNPDMFQSTPVQVRTSPGSCLIPMASEISKVLPRADDKENMIAREPKDESPKPKGKKRQPAKREAVAPADSEPARYNLRKRTKRII